MSDVFIINPKADATDLQQALDERITLARAICIYAADGSTDSTGEFINNTFAAVDHLLGEAQDISKAIASKTANDNGERHEGIRMVRVELPRRRPARGD